jgi:hypothetical protein
MTRSKRCPHDSQASRQTPLPSRGTEVQKGIGGGGKVACPRLRCRMMVLPKDHQNVAG